MFCVFYTERFVCCYLSGSKQQLKRVYSFQHDTITAVSTAL